MDNSGNTTEMLKKQKTGIRGTIRNMARCGLITPETQLQAGLRSSDRETPSRLFFGEQTSPGSLAIFSELKLAGIAVAVEVSGYFKYQRDAHGETYLDESALFVEDLEVIG